MSTANENTHHGDDHTAGIGQQSAAAGVLAALTRPVSGTDRHCPERNGPALRARHGQGLSVTSQDERPIRKHRVRIY